MMVYLREVFEHLKLYYILLYYIILYYYIISYIIIHILLLYYILYIYYILYYYSILFCSIFPSFLFPSPSSILLLLISCSYSSLLFFSSSLLLFLYNHSSPNLSHSLYNIQSIRVGSSISLFIFSSDVSHPRILVDVSIYLLILSHPNIQFSSFNLNGLNINPLIKDSFLSSFTTIVQMTSLLRFISTLLSAQGYFGT